jgi:PAS domain S-box-containing protein
MQLKGFPIKYLHQINPAAGIKSYQYTGVIKYTLAGLLLGTMLVLNGLLLNYQSGFKGPWFHIFDYSPDFAVIILSPLLLGLLFCFIGIRREQLVLFNKQIKYHLSQEKMFNSAADQQISLLAKIISQVNEAVIIANKEGYIQWVNEGFTKISGYELDEVFDKRPGQLLQGPLTNKATVNRIRENIMRGEAVVEELLNYHKNGTPYWIRISIKPIYDESGEIANYIAIESDITSQKEKEFAIQSLYKEVADYKFALDQSAIVIIFNTAGKVEHVNKKFCEVNGVEDSEIVGKDYRSISLSMRDKAFLNPIWQKLNAGEIWKGELVNRNYNGKSYWADTTIVPLLGTNGKPHHFLAIQNDITERKELEQELITNKNKLERALQISQLGAWELDTQNKTVYLSNELRQIYKLNHSNELTLDELFGMMHPEDASLMKQKMQQQVYTGDAEEMEYRFMIDGEMRYMVSNISPKYSEDGRIIGAFGTVKDITQRKLTELALKKSEEEKAAVLNNAQTMICLHDLDGKIIDVNAAGETMSGFSMAEVVGLNMRLIVSPEYRAHFEDYLKEIKANKKATGSLQIITKTGQKRAWLYQNSLYENNGNAPYVIASAIDITDSVKAQNEIERQRQFISQIIDNSPNVIFVMNEQGEIVLSNRTFCHYYDYNGTDRKLAESLSKGNEDIFLGDVNDMLQLNEGDMLRFDGCMQSINDGSTGWFSVIKKCFTEKSGKRYVLGFGMDITARHQVECDLIAANEMVERSLKVKDQFISNMSHEIRTPLNAVIGFTDLMAETKLDAQQTEYIQIVKTASQNLLALINNILDLSKIESGHLALENLPIDVKRIAGDAVKIMEPKARNKGIQLICNLSANLPEKVIGDQLRLSQILYNLMGNAVKFTDEGFVELSCKLVSGSDSQKQYISFTVRDTGIGVALEKQEDIFERFTQANVDTQRLYGGTGLGLNIAKSIVDMHGGTLTMESEQGRGTTFHFILPYKRHENTDTQADVKAIDGATILAINAANPIKVLLAEDNMVNAMLARQVLENGGFKVEHVVNGALALERVQQCQFDIVLMDIQMPVMNGILATRSIRGLASGIAKIPIVAMTAHSLYGEMQNCYNAGMDGYVAKPFKPENLFAAIVDAVKGSAYNKDSDFSFQHTAA